MLVGSFAAASASAELSGVAIGRMNIISINNAIDALQRLRSYATSVVGARGDAARRPRRTALADRPQCLAKEAVPPATARDRERGGGRGSNPRGTRSTGAQN